MQQIFLHKYHQHTEYKEHFQSDRARSWTNYKFAKGKRNILSNMAWSENEDRQVKAALNLDNAKIPTRTPSASPIMESSQGTSTAPTVRGKPPALIHNQASQGHLNPKLENLSDGELSDFSLNDTEEDEEEFRNCVLLNGAQNEGTSIIDPKT